MWFHDWDQNVKLLDFQCCRASLLQRPARLTFWMAAVSHAAPDRSDEILNSAKSGAGWCSYVLDEKKLPARFQHSQNLFRYEPSKEPTAGWRRSAAERTTGRFEIRGQSNDVLITQHLRYSRHSSSQLRPASLNVTKSWCSFGIRFGKISESTIRTGRGTQMILRSGIISRLNCKLVAVAAILITAPVCRTPELPHDDSIQRAKELAWLNNWAEAARALNRMKHSGTHERDSAARIFAKAVEIRGNIESSSWTCPRF